MLSPEEIWGIFHGAGALLQGHFRLTSGRHSNRYVQCARVLQDPGANARLCLELKQHLGLPAVEVVLGPATGGIILAYELARQFGVRALFTERENGVMALRRGFEIRPGEKVLVVEDVITTGGSVRETIEVVRELGGDVVACAALVDRSLGQVKLPVPMTALLSMEIQTYAPGECPLCDQGLPLVKPGSRKVE